MAPQIWEQETPETDYERWLRELDLGYQSAEKAQNRLLAPNSIDQAFPITIPQKSLDSPGLRAKRLQDFNQIARYRACRARPTVPSLLRQTCIHLTPAIVILHRHIL